MNSANQQTTKTYTGASAGERTGENIGDKVKRGVHAIHGAGEAIRGNLNAVADGAFDSQAGTAKNNAIAQQGQAELNQAAHGTTHGTTGTTTHNTAL